MDEAMILDVFTQAIRTILMLSAPMLLVGLFVGLVVAVFQATTQIQEQTLAFVPKILAIFLTLLLTTSWLFSELIDFTMRLFDMIDQLVV
jgi:flagellar biosynthetic protein FliQ